MCLPPHSDVDGTIGVRRTVIDFPTQHCTPKKANVHTQRWSFVATYWQWHPGMKCEKCSNCEYILLHRCHCCSRSTVSRSSPFHTVNTHTHTYFQYIALTPINSALEQIGNSSLVTCNTRTLQCSYCPQWCMYTWKRLLSVFTAFSLSHFLCLHTYLYASFIQLALFGRLVASFVSLCTFFSFSTSTAAAVVFFLSLSLSVSSSVFITFCFVMSVRVCSQLYMCVVCVCFLGFLNICFLCFFSSLLWRLWPI